MIAAWDWHHPRTTPEEERHLAALTAELGFDTLVIGNPSSVLVDACHDQGVRVCAVVSPVPSADFLEAHPDGVQRMLEAEEAATTALRGLPPGYNADAGRWFPLFQPSQLICYRHPAALAHIRSKIGSVLDRADGVALDGFGFRNHHRCFCPRCADAAGGDPVAYSRETLISCSQALYRCAKEHSVDAVVMNHVWPPFRPDPGYSAELQLDYCSETVSWFYPPVWSLERVELELRSRSNTDRRNEFVPFIGLFWEDRCRRSAERIEAEIEIARRYAPQHLVFSTLSGVLGDESIRQAVAEQLRRYRR